MAGTDRTRPLVEVPAPAVVLVRPQMAENMGMTARAMLNFALSELHLVKPREDHRGARAQAAAAGAGAVLERATIHQTTEEAVAGFQTVYATTARPRDMAKPVLTPRAAAAEMRTKIAAGQTVAVMFGREKSGLDNDDIALADAIIEAPLNPGYSSLNLSQAVLLVGYEWYQAGDDTEPRRTPTPGTEPASKEVLVTFFRHLEAELIDCGFLRLEHKRPSMVRNIRNMFQRAGLTDQEVRTLHGMVSELRWGRRPDRFTADGEDRARTLWNRVGELLSDEDGEGQE